MRVNELIARTRSKEDVSESDSASYARYLGLDPQSDKDLLWLVDEALSAPLPEDWSEHFDGKGRIYYYNVSTDSSSWAHPTEIEFIYLVKLIKNPQTQHIAAFKDEFRALDRGMSSKLRLYQEHVDLQTNRRFFFNTQTGRSSWTDPRGALLHLLKVKGKILDILASRLPTIPSGGLKPPRQPQAPTTTVSSPKVGGWDSRASASHFPKFSTYEEAEVKPLGPALKRKAGVGVKLAPLGGGI